MGQQSADLAPFHFAKAVCNSARCDPDRSAQLLRMLHDTRVAGPVMPLEMSEDAVSAISWRPAKDTTNPERDGAIGESPSRHQPNHDMRHLARRV
jgi:hypothetical protein